MPFSRGNNESLSVADAAATGTDREPLSGVRVWITGWGLVTPLGVGAWPTFRALLAGRTLVDGVVGVGGAVDPCALVRAAGVAGVGRAPGVDPAVDLAERAAREAAAMAGVGVGGCEVVLATSKGAVTKLSEVVGGGVGRGGVVGEEDALAVALGACGYMSMGVGRRLGVPVGGHVVAACASSLTGVHGARLMLGGGAGGRGAWASRGGAAGVGGDGGGGVVAVVCA